MLTVEDTVVRIAPLEAAAASAAAALGLPVAGLKFVFALLVAYLPASLNQLLPHPALRHAWLGVSGLLLTQFFCGADYIHVAGIAATYYAVHVGGLALANVLGARLVARWLHWVCAVAVFSYLTACQWRREMADSANVDFSAPMMVTTIKLYTLAYNIYDGSVGRAGLEAALAAQIAAGKGASTAAGIYRDRLARALTRPPSLLEFFGYIFNPATVLGGPAFEASEYLAAQAGRVAPAAAATSSEEVNTETAASVAAKRPATRSATAELGSPKAAPSAPAPASPAIPAAAWGRRWGYAAACLLLGLAMLGAFSVIDNTLPIGAVHLLLTAPPGTTPGTPGAAAHFAAEPTAAAAASWFLPLPFALKLVVMHCALSGKRLMYYSVWKMAEGAAVAGGFGYVPPAKGKGGAAGWHGVANVRPLDVESSSSSQTILRHWNLHTQSWLQRYVFLRAPRAGDVNRWITFGVSAFWHGFFPGYYMGFFTVPLLQAGSKAFLSLWEPLVVSKVAAAASRGSAVAALALRVEAAARFVTMHLHLDYALMAFCLLDSKRGWESWAALGYVGHIGPLAALVAAPLLKPLLVPKAPKAKAA